MGGWPLLVYLDTKIRLSFYFFKILSERKWVAIKVGWVTCHEGETTADFLDSWTLSLLQTENRTVLCLLWHGGNKQATSQNISKHNEKNRAAIVAYYCRVTTINSRRLHCCIVLGLEGKNKFSCFIFIFKENFLLLLILQDRSESNWNTSPPILCFVRYVVYGREGDK